jgi:hypothetical protein
MDAILIYLLSSTKGGGGGVIWSIDLWRAGGVKYY